MEKIINDIEKIAWVSPTEDYIQLRFFIDTISQSEKFLTNIVAQEFGKLQTLGDCSASPNKPIDIKRVYDIISSNMTHNISIMFKDIIGYGNNPDDGELLARLRKCYLAFNSMRNAMFYDLKNSASTDVSIDNGRMEFIYGDNMYYDIYVDGQMYLPKLSEALVMNRILRETTIAGKIKGARKHFKDSLANKTAFRKCLGF
jgi:hypothetical protein